MTQEAQLSKYFNRWFSFSCLCHVLISSWHNFLIKRLDFTKMWWNVVRTRRAAWGFLRGSFVLAKGGTIHWIWKRSQASIKRVAGRRGRIHQSRYSQQDCRASFLSHLIYKYGRVQKSETIFFFLIWWFDTKLCKNNLKWTQSILWHLCWTHWGLLSFSNKTWT